MGQQPSRNEDGKQREQEREIKYIIDCLNHHKNNVYGVAHNVQAQNSHLEKLLHKMRHMYRSEESENDGDVKEDDIEDKTGEKIHLKDTKSKRRLLGSIQASLQCQSNSLLESFDALNQCIIDALHQFKQPDPGSSVDPKYSRKWIVYDGSPKQPICDIREAWKKEVAKSKRLEECIANYEEDFKDQDKAIRQMSEENNTLQKKKENIEQTLTEQTESLRTLKLSESTITTHNEQLSKDNTFLRSQLKTFKSTVQIQIFYQSRGEMMYKVLDELKSLLTSNIGTERNKVQFIDCLDKKDVNPDIPLFVLCINASRIGTDVATTIQKLKGCVSTKLIVLIFHHKDIHALPSQSSERVLTGPDFNTIGGIFDLAFLAEKGLYSCQMNENAANGIVKFLNAHD